MYILAIDPGYQNLALSLVHYKVDDEKFKDICARPQNINLKVKLDDQRIEGELLFATITDCSITSIPAIMNSLSNIINLENVYFSYERFVVYGRHSLQNIEKINQILGGFLVKFYEHGGNFQNVIPVTYKQWTAYLTRFLDATSLKDTNKHQKSFALFYQFFEQYPAEIIDNLIKFGDHICDSLLLSVYVFVARRFKLLRA